MQYAELQAKTAFSFLRGSSHPHEMVTRAAELGFHSLALTDHNGVYALPKAYRQLQDHPGLRLISGCELSIENHPSLTLIAKTRAGYGFMCRMITQAHADHPKGEGRLDWEALLKFLEDPKAQDLFVLPRTDLPTLDQLQVDKLRERVGKNLFLPLSRLLDGLDRKRTDALTQLSRKYDVPLVATNDAHYHEPHRSQLHDTMTAIRLNTTVQKAGLALFPNRERHLKSPAQMLRLFRDLPRALENTIGIAEACRFSLSELRYTYPSEWIPAGETAQGYLEHLTWKGAQGRYPSGTPPKVISQIEHELRLIQQLKFADYFLTIWEIVEFARSKNILCQGRGSAANSIICYCLGITAIDPVHMDLLFERFISVERGEPPDIDVDFEHDRREEVIQHVYEKYGRHRAGMVSAIITFRSRMALRETRKALGVEIPPQIRAEKTRFITKFLTRLMGQDARPCKSTSLPSFKKSLLN